MPETLANARLDACVKQLLGMSWNEARRAITTGKIFVGEQRVTDIAMVPGAGADLVLKANAPKPREQFVDVVYEDASVIVVDKPIGVVTVPFGDSKEDSLDARVRAHLNQKEKGRPELGVVHRLDKETSGLVVFTRTWAAKQALSEQFREHTVHRRYVAVVKGVPRGQTIVSNIGRDRGDGKRGSVEQGGERAVTHVEVLEALGTHALVACRLETGRTHQIRIHLSENGHPVMGDKVYGDVPGPRLMLHARELAFVLPGPPSSAAVAGSWPGVTVNNREMRFEREVDAAFAAVVERLRKR